MAEITAKLVAELRAKTGCGMMDCKNALKDSNGDFEAAVKLLREKGMAATAKKAAAPGSFPWASAAAPCIRQCWIWRAKAF